MKTVKGIYAAVISTGRKRKGASARLAVAKLQEKLADLRKEEKKKQDNAAWREHTRIVRGNPVRVYEGKEFVLKE